MPRIAFATAALLIAVPALAQSPYVAGTIGADISRVSHSESDLSPDSSNDSEALNGSLRVGTSVGSNWGVELGFARSGRSHSQGPVFYPLAAAGVPAVTVGTQFGVGNAVIPIPFEYRSEVTRRRSDLDVVAWARQPVSDSVDLVYLAGVAFSRERSDLTQGVTAGGRAILPPTEFHSTFIQYDTRPLVGIEARIGLASHMRLIPGFRLLALREGWLMRPYVGLGWFF